MEDIFATKVTVPRLEDIAASEVINNFYNIQFIVKKSTFPLLLSLSI